MKKIIAAVAVGALSSMSALAQDTLQWFSTFTGPGIVSPTNAATFVPASLANPLQGALVQLIRDGGNGTADAPNPLGGGIGLTGDDNLLNSFWVGGGIGDDVPYFYSSETIANLGIALSSSVYVRVWDQPTSGGGNVPNPLDYGGGNVGWYYFDAAVRLVSSLPNTAGLYDYEFDINSPSQWTFVAIPEPGTLALAGIGLAAMLLRLRRRNS